MRPTALRVDGANTHFTITDTDVTQHPAAQPGSQTGDATQQLAVTQVITPATTQPQSHGLQNLPDELIKEIISNLSHEDRLALRCFAATCRQLHELAESPRRELAVMDDVRWMSKLFVPGVTLPLFDKALAVIPQMRRSEHAVEVLTNLIKNLPLLFKEATREDASKAFHGFLAALPQGKPGSPAHLQRQFLLEALADEAAALIHPGMRTEFYCALADAGLENLPKTAILARADCMARMNALGDIRSGTGSVEEHRGTIVSAVSAISRCLYAFPVHEGKIHLSLVLGALGNLSLQQVDEALEQISFGLRQLPIHTSAGYAPCLLEAARRQGGGEVPDRWISPLMASASGYPVDVQVALFKRAWDKFEGSTDSSERKHWATTCMASLHGMGAEAAATRMPLVEAGLDKLLEAFKLQESFVSQGPHEKPQKTPRNLALFVQCARHVPPERQLAYMRRVFAKFGEVRAELTRQQIGYEALVDCFVDIGARMPHVLAASVYTICALDFAEVFLRWPGATPGSLKRVCKPLVLGLSGSDPQRRRDFFFELPARCRAADNESPRGTNLLPSQIQNLLLPLMASLDPSDRSEWVRAHMVGPLERYPVAAKLKMLSAVAEVCGSTTDTQAGLITDMWNRFDQLTQHREAGTDSDNRIDDTLVHLTTCLHLLPPDEQRKRFLVLWNDCMSGSPICGSGVRERLLRALFTSSLFFKSPANLKIAADHLLTLLKSRERHLYSPLLVVLQGLVSRLPGDQIDQLLIGLVELRDLWAPQAKPKVEEAPPGEPRQ